MKAGTAHKMVLNMLSTCSMVKTGKVYENLMINLRPSNIKLKNRMVRIVGDIMSCDEMQAVALLEKHGWNIRAIVDAEK
jgi:N-acetylmuramic acid 6-phosphate etherase